MSDLASPNSREDGRQLGDSSLENTMQLPSSSTVGTMESFSYDDAIVRMFLTATIVWGLVATVVGLLVAVLLVLPALFSFMDLQISSLLSFGRLRRAGVTLW